MYSNLIQWYIDLYLFFFGLFSCLGYYSVLSSSVYYTVGPRWLTCLYILMDICSSQPPHLSLPLLHLFCLVTLSLFSKVWVTVFLCKWVHLHWFLDVTHKWSCRLFVILWLPSLSTVISRSIYAAGSGLISSFFLMAESYSIVTVPHLLCHPSVHGHTGCFPIMAIVNSAAVNVGMQASFPVFFCL